MLDFIFLWGYRLCSAVGRASICALSSGRASDCDLHVCEITGSSQQLSGLYNWVESLAVLYFQAGPLTMLCDWAWLLTNIPVIVGLQALAKIWVELLTVLCSLVWFLASLSVWVGLQFMPYTWARLRVGLPA